jgi:hypothetical protein
MMVDSDYAMDLRRSVDAGRPVGRVAHIKEEYLQEVPGTGLRRLRTIITAVDALEEMVHVSVAGPRGYNNQRIFSLEEIRQYLEGLTGMKMRQKEVDKSSLKGNPAEAFYNCTNSLQGLIFLHYWPAIVPPARGNLDMRARMPLMPVL